MPIRNAKLFSAVDTACDIVVRSDLAAFYTRATACRVVASQPFSKAHTAFKHSATAAVVRGCNAFIRQ
jgi:hypothetical protein